MKPPPLRIVIRGGLALSLFLSCVLSLPVGAQDDPQADQEQNQSQHQAPSDGQAQTQGPEQKAKPKSNSKPKPETTPRPQVRIYRSPEERREAASGVRLTPWLMFGAVVDIEKEWKTDNYTNRVHTVENPNPELAIELGFELTDLEWLEGELLFAIEENGRRHFQEVDEGFLGVDFDGVGAKIGLLYVPFGEFYSHFVSGPMLEFAQTRRPAVITDYTLFDLLEISGYLFKGKLEKRANPNKHKIGWGVAAELVSRDESIRIGGGYISDLGEGDDGELFVDFNYKIKNHVPGWTLHGLIGIPPFEFTGEIVRATESFKEFDSKADKPLAYNLELAFYPPQLPWLQLAFRWEGSTELEDEPKSIYGLGISLRPFDNINMSVSGEYLRGNFRKGFSTDDNDNEQLSSDIFAVQATYLY